MLSIFLKSFLPLLFLLSPLLSLKAEEQKTINREEAIAAFEVEDRKLNAYWKELRKSVKTESWPSLLKDQKRWLRYRHGRANGIHNPDSREAFAEYWVTSAKLTRLRMDVLRDWKKELDAPWTNDWSGYYTCSLDGDDSYIRIMHYGNRAWFYIWIVQGPTYHVGKMMGSAEINGQVAHYSDNELRNPEIGKTRSWLTMLRNTVPGEQLRLIESNASHYHGARASFNGQYVRRRDLNSEEKRHMMVNIKEWLMHGKESKERHEKINEEAMKSIEPLMDLRTDTVKKFTDACRKAKESIKKLLKGQEVVPDYYKAAGTNVPDKERIENDGRIKVDEWHRFLRSMPDEPYKFLKELPEEDLRVWLYAYDHYRKAKESLSYVLSADQISSGKPQSPGAKTVDTGPD